MSGLPTIMIRRQIVDVEVHGSEPDGLALQHRLPDICARVLSPALESALGDFDQGDASLRIDSMAIELAGVSVEQLESELADAVRREAARQFRQHASPSARASPGLETSGEIEVRSRPQTVDEALEVFLETGRLPWSFTVPPGSTLESLVIETRTASSGAEGASSTVRRDRLLRVLADPAARTRLLLQFSPTLTSMVIRDSSPALAAAVAETLETVERAGVPGPARAAFEHAVWTFAVEAASTAPTLAPAELARAVWLSTSADQRAHPSITAALEQRWPGVTDPEEASPTGRDTTPPTMVPGHTPAASAGEQAGAPPSSEPPPEPSAGLQPERTAFVDVGRLAEEGGIIVDSAGIVLLHPFLPRFFDALEVSAGDELVDPTRALCLLHLLATGERVAPEHRLTLAKVLCNVPLGQPVEADVGITQPEEEEAAALLEATIDHWRALGNTSTEALRHEFLMRSGQLSESQFGEPLLRVETRTVDILLDHLPWGVSTVKLPWMPRPLWVEWR